MPANSRLTISNSKTKQEYHQINSELKDIAWKLYDLTCDFKDLKVDARQLCQHGHYDRYAKHKSMFSSEKECREMKSRLLCREEEEEEATESKRRRKYQSNDFDFEDFPVQYHQGLSSKMKVSNDDGYGYSSTSDYHIKKGYNAAADEYKQKFMKDFDKALASRRSEHVREFEEDLEKCKNRYQHDQQDSPTKNARCYSEYESLSTQDLEQRLREKLDLLQYKAKCLKENYCNGSRGEANYTGSSSSEIRCKSRSSKREKRNSSRPSPHRVYLDGGKTYVVNHTDSKVVFIPKVHEY